MFDFIKGETCVHCGHKIAADSRFCPGCGKPVVRDPVCPLCRNVDEKDAVFCRKCGTLLTQK